MFYAKKGVEDHIGAVLDIIGAISSSASTLNSIWGAHNVFRHDLKAARASDMQWSPEATEITCFRLWYSIGAWLRFMHVLTVSPYLIPAGYTQAWQAL